ncbi:hypothetical protein [Glycomyces sp. NRRL B-16210]|uniref:hypothetical protein n=1 Tax=Glycomyces sp. NRRL B-16210 TaxID=1463821 RepID=UPI0004C276AA|nr:hypothetical protein [Glycomyces sp. NRRL B-16210]
MAEVGWLRRSRDAKHVIITAPDGPAPGTEAAVAQLEGVLAGFSGAKPAWYRPLERLGRWWYAIVAALSAAAFVALAPDDAGTARNLAYGLLFSPIATLAVGGLLSAAAHLQVHLSNGGDRDQAIKAVADRARPAGSVADRVEAILAKDPPLEAQVHALAWKAAGIGEPNRKAANRELDELWRLADPAAAEARDAKIRQIEEQIARDRREGTA